MASLVDGTRTHGAPPTRLRYIVGSAIGSLSRLRRNPTVQDLVVADGGWIALSTPAAPDVAIAPSPERVEDERTNVVVVDRPPVNAPALPELDVLAVANLCTELGRVHTANGLQLLLREAATILDATGLIVWVWDGSAEGLRPALAHGCSDDVLAQLPAVKPDANNATAAAFRSGQTCAIKGSEHVSGALVVPMLTAADRLQRRGGIRTRR